MRRLIAITMAHMRPVLDEHNRPVIGEDGKPKKEFVDDLTVEERDEEAELKERIVKWCCTPYPAEEHIPFVLDAIISDFRRTQEKAGEIARKFRQASGEHQHTGGE